MSVLEMKTRMLRVSVRRLLKERRSAFPSQTIPSSGRRVLRFEREQEVVPVAVWSIGRSSHGPLRRVKRRRLKLGREYVYVPSSYSGW